MELMKPLILLALLLCAGVESAEKPIKKNEVKGGIVINESLKKLMEIEGVQAVYDICKKANVTSNNAMMDCLWTGVKSDEGLKKKVESAYAEEVKAKPEAVAAAGAASAGRAPASTPKTNMTGRNASSATDYESDPAVEALSKYYGEKLDAILDPEKALTKEENKKGLILATNHRQFIDLYKSELGKTIINAFTSYCLDTDPDTCKCTDDEAKKCMAEKDKSKCSCADLACTISGTETDRKAHREKNIASLKNANLSSDGPESIKWRACITSVPTSCKNSKVEKIISDQTETAKRSCLIMDYVESARKNIIAADAQKEFYDDLSKSQTASIAGMAKTVDDPKKTSSDAILEMSSEDVATALKKPMEKDIAEFEGCYKDGAIVNAKACEKYLNTNAKDNQMAIAELGIRQIAEEGNLQKELDSSDSKVLDYLKEEGFTKDQIADMTSDTTKIKQVKDEIMERYRKQKQAIVAEMAAKIESKTSTADGRVDTSDIGKLKKISEELSNRSNDLSGLVKFNNIVSSYLEVKKDGSKTNERNTASLFGEIADMKDADKVSAEAQLKSANLKENKMPDGQSQTNLDVNTINSEFLNYSTLKKKD